MSERRESQPEIKDAFLEQSMEKARKANEGLQSDDAATREEALKELKRVTEELQADNLKRMTQPEFGRLGVTETAQAFSKFDKWDDKGLADNRQSVLDWLDGKTDLYYLSPRGSRPTRGDLNAIEAEMRKRGLLK